MPSSDQIVWTSRPRRSARRASIASDQGAWTRPPNERQPPVAELILEALDHDPLVGRQGARGVALVLEIGQQVLDGPIIEVVMLLESLASVRPPLRAAVEIAFDLCNERPECSPELDRPPDRVALPERELARDARRGRDGDPVVADVLDPP